MSRIWYQSIWIYLHLPIFIINHFSEDFVNHVRCEFVNLMKYIQFFMYVTGDWINEQSEFFFLFFCHCMRCFEVILCSRAEASWRKNKEQFVTVTPLKLVIIVLSKVPCMGKGIKFNLPLTMTMVLLTSWSIITTVQKQNWLK